MAHPVIDPDSTYASSHLNGKSEEEIIEELDSSQRKDRALNSAIVFIVVIVICVIPTILMAMPR